MSKNTIKINGEKLRALLEQNSGKKIREISVDNGFSKNMIAEACRKGEASPIVQNIAKLYGIAPEAYKVKEERPELRQMTIDELEATQIKDLTVSQFAEIVEQAIARAFFKGGYN